ncbi:hypothetical protein ACOT81_39825 [Streptomyces sp. WI04-05B]|uniref:hypothetical protein n=1 Tax=Streptomyces TaxID=1883 RepID=UPI0029A93347|nr:MULTISPECIES: hypothetical protein [unclassified Streptomyces]MDX2548541.1 hypothetical protein [Streptomyces sp. WI04-05B]MDX2582599.1 hypothetical protein [Streptomyces sp. WI04-05A]MDX3747086.1 hypothetical protein [Streptomyces sp. AK08-02]
MSGTQLTLTISGGTAADAQTVVRALESAFGPADESPGDDDGHSTVHTAAFTVGTESLAPGHPTTTRLSAPVTVTVQGTPTAVRCAGDTLTGTFTAQDRGSVSGDQEQERQLLLEP